MKKIIFSICFLIIIYQSSIFGQETFKRLNYMAAGYVTQIYATPQSNSLSNYVLYARTDVGGIYRSQDNGNTWTYLTCYFWPNSVTGVTELSPSEMSIQGMAIKPNDPATILTAWGLDVNDAALREYKCIWRSSSSGSTFTWNRSNIESPGLWFQGNDNANFGKLGGECILFDPDNPNWVYAGGCPPGPNSNDQKAYLYLSKDAGNNFYKNQSQSPEVYHYPATNKDTIYAIAKKSGSNQLWVGTAMGVRFTTDNGSTWQFVTTGESNRSLKHIKRILLWGTDANRVAFVTWGANYKETNGSVTLVTGIGKIKHNGTNWVYDDLTDEFNAGLNQQHINNNTMFTALNFPKKTDGSGQVDENHLFAGKFGRPLRESFGSSNNEPGTTWGGYTQHFTNDWQIQLKYQNPQTSVPEHQMGNENYMYTGMNCLTQNPNFPTCWYSSGGAGAIKSENVTIFNSPDLGGNNSSSFKDSRWNYIANGMSFPVVYDIKFHNYNNNKLVYVPESDWALSWINNPWLNWNESMKFDRKRTKIDGENSDSYASNILRILVNPQYPYLTYAIGGSIHYIETSYGVEDKKAAFYVRDLSGGINTPTITRRTNAGFLTQADRFIADGVIYQTSGGANRIIVLVGRSSYPEPPGTYTTMGLFYSDNGGGDWAQMQFNGDSFDNEISTEAAYQNSILPSLIPGTTSELFSEQFHLAHAGGNKIYLYLQNGGLFVNDNPVEINNWRRCNVPNGALNEGVLKYIGDNKLALSIKGRGLFIGTIGSNNNVSWSSESFGFTQVTHFDKSNNKWAVFAKKNGDNYLGLYKSTNDGLNWQRIPENPTTNPVPLFPRVRSLRFNPDVNSELWIGTSGHGVWVYKGVGSADNPEPLYITDTQVFDKSDYYDRDIIVENNGNLTLQGGTSGINITLGLNRKIIVRNGGKINVNNVKFNEISGSQIWNGIQIESPSGNVSITNSTFKKSTSPVRIVNTYGNPSTEFQIKNNTFDMSGITTASNVLYFKNSNKINIDNNIFSNPGGSQSITTVMIDNNVNPGLAEGGEGEGGGEAPNIYSINVTNNNFSNGQCGIYMIGTSNYMIPCNIFNNTMNLSGSSGVNFGMILFKSLGEIKRNKIFFNAASNGDNGISLNNSRCYLEDNIINSKNSNLFLSSNAVAILSPTVLGNQTIWFGGKNVLYSSQSDNVNFSSNGSNVDVNNGENSITSLPNKFHINGTVSDPNQNIFYAYRNCWDNSQHNARFNIRDLSGNPIPVSYFSPSYGCLPSSTNIFQIRDLGFDLFDTVYSSSNETDDTLSNEDLLLNQGVLHMQTEYHTLAITNFQNFITGYPANQNSIEVLYNLNHCYQSLDTNLTDDMRDTLYSNFKNFLTDRINSGLYSNEFIDVAANLILSCEANIKKYHEALSGYEFIAMYHPDPEQRLLASWDYNELLAYVNGMGGGEKVISHAVNIIDFQLKQFEKLNELADRKPLLNLLKESYKKQGVEELSKPVNNKKTKDEKSLENNKERSGKYDNQIYKEIKNKALSNLFLIKNLNKEERLKKKQEDYYFLAGLNTDNLTTTDNKESLIPDKFTLSQNYPNPFNPNTKISFSIPKELKVSLKVYDVTGREVAILVNETKGAGNYVYEFNGINFSSGVYFYRIQAGEFIETKRMMLIK